MGAMDGTGERLRVLMVCPPLPTDQTPGGMAPTARQFQSLERMGVEVQCLDMRGPKVVKYLMKFAELRRRVEQVDIVHAHYGYCGLLASTQFRKPLVISFMGSDINGFYVDNGRMQLGSRMEVLLNRSITCRLGAKIIVKSMEMARRVPRDEVAVLPNGVDMELFAPMDRTEAKRHLGWPEATTHILFPANPQNPNKGFDLASQVVQEASQRLRRPLELVPMWGHAPDRVPVLMNAANLVLFTSYKEGSPNVIKEAMACNSAIVSTPVGDVPELLQDMPGARIGEFSTQSLAGHVVDLLRSEELPKGRERLMELQLSLDQVASRLVKIYKESLQEYPAKRG